MEGKFVNQDKNLVLASKVFYLTHKDVLEIDKTRLRKEVMDSLTADIMIPYYKTLVAEGIISEAGSEQLEKMNSKISAELNELDKVIVDAEKNLGESEIQKAHLAKFLFLIQIGDKENADDQLTKTESKTMDVGEKVDLVLCTLRMGFFYEDFNLIRKNIDKVKEFNVEGHLESIKHLKVYEGLFCMFTRDFKKASALFLASLPTFKTCELLSYETFILYTVLTSLISLDQGLLKQQVLDAPEILAVRGNIPHLSEFMKSLDECRYKSFFRAFVDLTMAIKLDRYLHRHYYWYTTMVRITVYSQYLKSNKSATLDAMATAFGVTVDFINSELVRFTKAGKLELPLGTGIELY